MSGINTGTSKIVDNFALKKGVSELKFSQKFEEAISDKKLTKSEFKDLASKLVGGEKALKEILGRVIPHQDVKGMLAGLGSLGSTPIKLDNVDKRELYKIIKSEILKEKPAKSIDTKTPDVSTSGGTLRIPKNAKVEDIKNPQGLRANVNTQIVVGGVTFEPSEKCLMVEKGGKTYIQKLDKDSSGQPTKPKGDPIELSNTDIAKLTKEQTFKKIDTPLFPDGKISAKDVKQGAIGNCFAIAAIYSIAKENPDAIKKMLKDNGDGTVTVKLFDKDEHGKIVPKYIKMEKSTLQTDEHANDSLWVQMLEKGYATLKGSYQNIAHGGQSKDALRAFLGNDFTKHPFDPKSVESTVLESLNTKTTVSKTTIDNLKVQMTQWCKELDMPAPTEKQLKTLDSFKDKKINPNELIETMKSFGFDNLNAVNLVGNHVASPELEKVKEMVKDLGPYPIPTFSQEKMNGLKTQMTSWFSQLGKTAPTSEQLGELDKLVGKNVSRTQIVEKLKSFGLDPVNSESLSKIHFPEHPFNPDDVLKGAVDQKKFDTLIKGLKEKYPANKHGNADKVSLIEKLETAGKGKFKSDEMNMKTDLKMEYKPQELKMFNDIKKALEKGKFVCIDTKPTIGISTGSGHSGGEPTVDGLAGGHAYAVLDTVQMGGRIFVKVANPWGNNFSRDYTPQPDGSLKAKKHDPEDYKYKTPPTVSNTPPTTVDKPKEKEMQISGPTGLKEFKPLSKEAIAKNKQEQLALLDKDTKGEKIGENESWIELNDLSSDFASIHIMS